MIVADTNIISYLLLPTTYSESVDAVFKLDSKWVAPLLWKSEFRNVLALYLRKKLSISKKPYCFRKLLNRLCVETNLPFRPHKSLP